MGNFRLCPFFDGRTVEFKDTSSYIECYKSVLMPVGSFLFSHPEVYFSFYFSGPQLEAIKSRNPEYLDLLKKLADRKQIEIIGGGYYNPLFPILFPLDRSGQIEMHSSFIRQCIGKRPRGLVLYADSWDPSLITTFENCSMEYVLMDSSLIPPVKQKLLPIIMSDRGKKINILPVHNEFAPLENETPEEYLKRIQDDVLEISKIDSNPDADRIIPVAFSKNELIRILEGKWLDRFITAFSSDEKQNVSFSLPTNAVRNSKVFVQAFISANINGHIARWCYKPFDAIELTDGYPTNIYDFLQTYTISRALYDRMIFVSLLVNQSHGDKIKKKTARELLWEAQAGEAFVCSATGSLVNTAYRQTSYKNLGEVERIIRSCSDFNESISCYDYNSDGLKEYICRLDKYNTSISLKGGSIFELTIMNASGNYTDNRSRMLPFDVCNDNYFRGIFSDHLFEEEDFENYCRCKPVTEDCTAGIYYTEEKFSSQKHDIYLSSMFDYGTLNQPVSLKKKYFISSSGISVQYIIKNESPFTLKAKFISESNFSESGFKSDSYSPYGIEIVSGGEIKSDFSDSDIEQNPECLFNDVSGALITDSRNNVSFMFEPNENAMLTYGSIAFKRPDMGNNLVTEKDKTFYISFAWNVELSAGMEMEKTINLTINHTKKKRK